MKTKIIEFEYDGTDMFAEINHVDDFVIDIDFDTMHKKDKLNLNETQHREVEEIVLDLFKEEYNEELLRNTYNELHKDC